MRVVLLTVDCLRADHITPETAPNLCALSDSFEAFGSCFATGTKTRDSAQMILTSSYPSQHGGNTRLEATQTGIQEVLSGIETGFFHTNPLMSAEFGYDKEFDEYVDFGVVERRDDQRDEANPLKTKLRGVGQRLGLSSESQLWKIGERLTKQIEPWNPPETVPYTPAEEIFNQFRAWEPDDDYFAWIHIVDPHTPYKIRPEYIESDIDQTTLEEVANRVFQMDDDGIIETELSDQQQQAVRELYRSEVRYVDDAVEDLVASLTSDPDGGLLVSADHGEHLFEYDGRFQHHAGLWDELIEVPWLVSLPDDAGEIADGTPTLLDIAPTIATLFDQPAPESWQGRSIVDPQPDEPLVGEYISKSGVDPYFVYADTGQQRVGCYPTRDSWVELDRDEGRMAETETPPDELQHAITNHLEAVGSTMSQQQAASEEVTERLAELGYME